MVRIFSTLPSSLLITLSLACAGISSSPANATSGELDVFRNIYIDLRGSLGGKGDVAAGFLTGEDLLTRLAFDGKLTLVVDDETGRIVSNLLGRPVRPGAQLAGTGFRFETAATLSSETREPADLYLSLARPSGIEKALERDIPLDEETVRITQTVLGNTGNPHSRQTSGTIRRGERRMLMPPPGIAAEESGIYYDPEAIRLRDAEPATVKETVLESLGKMPLTNVRDILTKIVKGDTLAERTLGLVYGVTAAAVKPQFETFLDSLATSARRTGKAYVLLTPSGFSLAQVSDPALRRMIRVFDLASTSALPAVAEIGAVTIVKTGALPHELFVGLMALSDLPPIVAGDGALCAAIAIGKPFLMTQVEWNRNNVVNLSHRLEAHLSGNPNAKAILEKWKESDLSISSEIAEYREAFHALFEEIPSFTDALIRAASEML